MCGVRHHFAITFTQGEAAIQSFLQWTGACVERCLLSQAFFAKIVEGLAKAENSPYVSPRDADAAFHMRL
ncbi:hypothetical protein A6R70_08580 [Agrobacterium rubi]|nr:hypothetical protein [Agrobacterium rubi]